MQLQFGEWCDKMTETQIKYKLGGQTYDGLQPEFATLGKDKK